MLEIVFLDSDTFPESIDFSYLDFPHQLIQYPLTRTEEIIERCQDADIVITNKVVFSASIMQQLPKLKLIAITATGMNNVDLAAAKMLNIKVCNVAGYSDVSVPEHVLALIFALKRNLAFYYQGQLQAKWPDSPQFCYFQKPIEDVKGSVLGIIGKGSLGSSVAVLAKALGMKVIFAERQNATTCREGYLPFNQVLAQADIVSLHCPLTEETKYLINKDTLKLFKVSAFLINTGRGDLVDETALYQALIQKELAGAALDVLSTEPPDKNNILIQAGQTLSNLIITPHIAWASNSAIDRLVTQVTNNINQFVANLRS